MNLAKIDDNDKRDLMQYSFVLYYGQNKQGPQRQLKLWRSVAP
jgi:hypothetical protein